MNNNTDYDNDKSTVEEYCSSSSSNENPQETKQQRIAKKGKKMKKRYATSGT
jgi:hypothetical protein